MGANLKLSFLSKFLISLLIFYSGLSIGYSSIDTQSLSLDYDSDILIYRNIAKEGIEGVRSSEHRSTRLAIPLAAYGLSKINPFDGKYNSPRFNIFLVNIVIFYITVISLFWFSLRRHGLEIATLTVVFYFSHFMTINLFFYGVPDSLEFLLSICLFIILCEKKYFYLLPLFIIAALNRESFLIFAIPILIIWSISESNSHKFTTYLFYSFISILTFLLVVYFLKSFIQNDVSGFSTKITSLINFKKVMMFLDFDQMRNLLYSLLLLVPVGIYGLKKDKVLFIPALTILAIYFLIGGMMVGSGAALGRYIFSSVGPILLIGQSIVFIDLYNQYKKLND